MERNPLQCLGNLLLLGEFRFTSDGLSSYSVCSRPEPFACKITPRTNESVALIHSLAVAA